MGTIIGDLLRSAAKARALHIVKTEFPISELGKGSLVEDFRLADGSISLRMVETVIELKECYVVQFADLKLCYNYPKDKVFKGYK